jgi:hypothetical protein
VPRFGLSLACRFAQWANARLSHSGACRLDDALRIRVTMPSDASFVDEAAYNQLFNMFGTMMMFLLAVPIGQGSP